MRVAGVLDFTAVEGTIGMPPLVARNLLGEHDGASDQTSVTVTYRRLQKGAPCHGRELEVHIACRLPMHSQF